jgi:hypothetical protein
MSCPNCKYKIKKISHCDNNINIYSVTCIHNIFEKYNELIEDSIWSPRSVTLENNNVIYKIKDKCTLRDLIYIFDTLFGDNLHKNYTLQQNKYYRYLHDEIITDIKMKPNSCYLENIIKSWY